jgi:uncharacterized protein
MVRTDRLRDVLDAGDVDGLRELLAADPRLADAGIAAGPEGSDWPPIHHVCNLAFEGRLDRETARALARQLLAAGANPNGTLLQNGDCLLISAVSLCCPEIALDLMAAGADVRTTGLFGASALHWAAMLGFPTVVMALLEAGAEVNQEDMEYDSTPLGWAVEGWTAGTNGGTREQPACARLLVQAGGHFNHEDVEGALKEDEHGLMRQALRLGT